MRFAFNKLVVALRIQNKAVLTDTGVYLNALKLRHAHTSSFFLLVVKMMDRYVLRHHPINSKRCRNLNMPNYTHKSRVRVHMGVVVERRSCVQYIITLCPGTSAGNEDESETMSISKGAQTSASKSIFALRMRPVLPIFRLVTLSLSLFFTLVLLGLSGHLLSASLASGGHSSGHGTGNDDTDDTLDQFDIPHRRHLSKRLVGDGGSQNYEGLGIATAVLSLLVFTTLFVLLLFVFVCENEADGRMVGLEWEYSGKDLSFLGISLNCLFSVRLPLLLFEMW